MFSTNLIQSNYGDLNIKSLAFDSFKERLQSTMTALTFFISTGQCDCDEIAESNFNVTGSFKPSGLFPPALQK
ncbi:hypothetical protein C9345_17535 [Escherichia coli]|nr:hypothetical protein C9345_17535 [Escherichia coli]